jgi:single-strand DNA-binding protein
MALNLNKVLLAGNLTRDVELRHTAGNQAIAKVGLAVNRRWKTPEGEQREETMFVDCEAWGKTAEFIAQYFSKGRPIFIEGRLKLDQWEDKETKAKRSKHVVVIDNVQFVDSKPGGGGGAGGGESGTPRSSRPAPAGASSGPAPQEWGGKGPMGEEDIPF